MKNFRNNRIITYLSMKTSIKTLLFLFFFSHFSQAQSEKPKMDMKATQDYINELLEKNKLTSNNIYFFAHHTHNGAGPVATNGDFSLFYFEDYFYNYRDFNDEFYFFNILDVEFTYAFNEKIRFIVKCKNNEKCIRREVQKHNDIRENLMINDVNFFISSKKAASRLVNALNHARSLCTKEIDPFDN